VFMSNRICWFSLFTPAHKRPVRSSSPALRFRPMLEQMEERVVPCGSPLSDPHPTALLWASGCGSHAGSSGSSQDHHDSGWSCGPFEGFGWDCGKGHQGGSGGQQGQSETLSGVVYSDPSNTGDYATSDIGLSGVTVTLTGKTSSGKTVSKSVVTGNSGAFSFSVAAGTYTLSYTPATGYETEATAQAPPGAVATAGAVGQPGQVANITVTTGHSLVVNLPEVQPSGGGSAPS
jgi:hypothetical protein